MVWIEFWVDSSFLYTLEQCSTSFWLPVFWWEIYYHWNVPPVSVVFSCHLQDFFLFFFSFQMFGYDLSWFYFFGFILLGFGFFSVLWILCFDFYQFWKGFKHFWTTFSVPSFPSGKLITWFLDLLFLSHRSLSLWFFFFYIYFLLYRLDKCFIFEFTDSFFCFLHSAVQFICRFKYILF